MPLKPNSYDVASADVVMCLPAADADAIADALEYLAGVDEGEHTDHDALVRLGALVRAHTADPVDVVLAALPQSANFMPPLEVVEAADRALSGLPHYGGSVPEGRRFVADVMVEQVPADDRRALAAWLVEELTAE